MSCNMPEVKHEITTVLNENLKSVVAQYNCLQVSCNTNVGSRAYHTSSLMIEAGKVLAQMYDDGVIKSVNSVDVDLYNGVINIFYESNV
jgi:hypothetical protein